MHINRCLWQTKTFSLKVDMVLLFESLFVHTSWLAINLPGSVGSPLLSLENMYRCIVVHVCICMSVKLFYIAKADKTKDYTDILTNNHQNGRATLR